MAATWSQRPVTAQPLQQGLPCACAVGTARAPSSAHTQAARTQARTPFPVPLPCATSTSPIARGARAAQAQAWLRSRGRGCGPRVRAGARASTATLHIVCTDIFLLLDRQEASLSPCASARCFARQRKMTQYTARPCNILYCSYRDRRTQMSRKRAPEGGEGVDPMSRRGRRKPRVGDLAARVGL